MYQRIKLNLKKKVFKIVLFTHVGLLSSEEIPVTVATESKSNERKRRKMIISYIDHS